MSKVKTKYQGIIDCTNSEASNLKLALTNPNVSDDTFLEVGPLTVRKKQIDSVLKEPTRTDTTTTENVYRDYIEYRKEKLSQSPEVRGKTLSFFKLFYFAMTSKNGCPKNTMTEAIKLQQEFFKKNPKRIYPDPMIFKSLIPKDASMSIISSAGFRFIERCVFEDKGYAK